VRLLLNIIWFVLCGLWTAIAYAIAAPIPVSLLPLGREIVPTDQASDGVGFA
jgi:uncharacterized membrane protein YccF (DUF307 family)